jgi:hypothetical protein
MDETKEHIETAKMDENKAIKRLLEIRSKIKPKTELYIDGGVEAIDLAIKALEGKDIDVPTKWIPVSKRLPIKELEERVDLVGKGAVFPCLVTMCRTVHEKYFDGEDFIDIYGDVCTDWVKAWMPRPEPYTE